MTKSILSFFITASTLLMITCAAHADHLTGYIFHVAGGFSFSQSTDPDDISAGPLTSTDPAVLSTLNKLQNGDSVTGVGSLQNGSWNLSEIDFVGLNALIGYWTSNSADLIFDSFNTGFGTLPTPEGSGHSSSYNYSIVPTQDSSWRLLLSDGTNTHLARMVLTGTQLSLQFVDAVSGNIVNSLNLTRTDSNNP